MFCKKCGKKILSGDKFCSACGNIINLSMNGGERMDESPKTQKLTSKVTDGNRNKIIGFGLIGSLALCTLAAMIPSLADVGYTVGGLGMWVFGIWAAFILLKK